MPSPDVTRVYGILYDASGDVMANARFTVRQTIKSGVLVSTRPVDYRTNDDGELVDHDAETLGIPILRDSVAYLDATAVGLNTRPGTGVALTIPDAATANLEDLVPATSTTLPGASQAALNTHASTIAGPSILGHVMVPAENIDEDGLLIFPTESAWGSIGGTLSDQTDLQSALDDKADLVGGTIPDNQIPGTIARDTEVTAAVAAEATARDTAISAASTTDRDRANHTGTQLAATISDFSTAALTAAPAETITTTGALISGATSKPTPVDADTLGLSDSAASNILKKLTWANLKATLKTYFDTLYQAASANLTALSALLTAGTNLVEQRNGANAQTVKVYGSYTDASNYIRGNVSMSSNNFVIQTERAGTGTALNYLSLFGGNGGVQLGINGSTNWIVSSTGHFLAATDNVYDIGASAASRPRNIYAAGTISGKWGVSAKTGAYTVVAADVGTYFTNTGAAGSVTFTLPTPAAGLWYQFYVDASQAVVITATGSATIKNGTNAATAANGSVTNAGTAGSTICLIAISATQWVTVDTPVGTWT